MMVFFVSLVSKAQKRIKLYQGELFWSLWGQIIPFSYIVQLIQKRVKIILKVSLFKTFLTSVTETRSLSYIFIFKESKKSLTVDSFVLFHKFSPLSLKMFKTQLRRNLRAHRLDYTFFVSSIFQSEKGVNLCWTNVLSNPSNECTRNNDTRNIFNFKESEKRLTMDSIILLGRSM